MSSPHDEYERRLERRLAEYNRLARLETVIGHARVAIFLAGAALAWFVFVDREIGIGWLAAPIALFIILAAWHDRIRRASRKAHRGRQHYESGLRRLNGLWPGRGEQGRHLLDPDHPYATDLDLFGPGSLFERLCRARTQCGLATLAKWLLAPAEKPEVVLRQSAVADLRVRLDLREEIDRIGADVGALINPENLSAWGSAGSIVDIYWTRLVAWTLSIATLTSLLIWLVFDKGRPIFLLTVVLQLIFATSLRSRVEQIVAAVDRKALELTVLARILGCLLGQEYTAPLLRSLRASFDTGGRSPAIQLARLGRLVEQLEWKHNQIFAPIAMLLLWTTHHALAIEAWRKTCGPAISVWLNGIGEFEALLDLAAYAYENPEDAFPEICTQEPVFDSRGLGHPLIPLDKLVRNDLNLSADLRLLIVSGSNMSGKSTLLRTVGANTVLALAGAPVRALSLRISPFAIAATLRIQDSLQAGRSRFYAEITRIRQLIDLTRRSMPVLFLLDELFQGTNSHDRRLGAEAVVCSLVKGGAIGLVTTHDLALTQIADQLGRWAANVHFEDHFDHGVITFDYRMRPGVVRKSNALALMRAVGLEVPTDGAAQATGLQAEQSTDDQKARDENSSGLQKAADHGGTMPTQE
jgi:hypothetical protein